jgi:hypothetical protein
MRYGNLQIPCHDGVLQHGDLEIYPIIKWRQ